MPGLLRGEHPAVTLSLRYGAFGRLIQLIGIAFRRETDLAIEVVMLRHEVGILRRQVRRPALEPLIERSWRDSHDCSPASASDGISSSRNLAGLAPGPRRHALGLPTRPARLAGHREGNHFVGPAVGEREPDVGRPPHPRRGHHHGHHHRPLERLGDPEAPRASDPSPRRSGPTWAEVLAAQAKALCVINLGLDSS